MEPYSSLEKTPLRLEVAALVNSRYPNGERPASWDDRKEGIDVIKTVDGLTVKLLSDGGQTPPQKGWTIMVSGGSVDNGYSWTLYGLPQGAVI